MNIEDEWNLVPVLKRFNADDYDIVYALTSHLDKWADTYLEDVHKIKQGAFLEMIIHLQDALISSESYEELQARIKYVIDMYGYK